ncbi:tafazzin [Hyalella azteca]|uniref:Tafazzin family protein n=1 Tax=Hyalella azteca TaxID=294128 RepID=A0A8B7P659_HYAAZ|nr:tafazzin [Hyalella azteca]XP_018020588.1 tafazzin [Hyalella azteca]XP_047741353.1 tafazzin [Hyalella azteca]XP_047741354.1 tafazzin [Hyalella azteca]
MAPDTLRFGWPFPEMNAGVPSSFVTRSSAIVPIVGTLSKVWLCYLNSVTVHNGSTFSWWVNKRPRDQPLITVSNHHSCMDDPFLYGILPWKSLWSAHLMRWSLAAHDIVFTTRSLNWFFSSGKCVPCIRGNGVFQQGMDFCCSRLREGSWVHIFPEGKVNEKKEILRLKWGIGRLIYDCWSGKSFLLKQNELINTPEPAEELSPSLYRKISGNFSETSSVLFSALHKVRESLRLVEPSFSLNSSSERKLEGNYSDSLTSRVSNHTMIKNSDLARFPGKAPIILIIYHLGMDSVLPNTRPFIPRVGKRVTIVVGEPLDTGPLLAQLSHDKVSKHEAMKRITDWLEIEFRKLGARTAELHAQT